MDETLKQFNPTLLTTGTDIETHSVASDNETGNGGSNAGDETLEGDF